jgi:hypothetical protein
MTEKIGDQVDRVNGTSVLLNVFLEWTRNDSENSQEWLLENWEDKTLKDAAFEGSLRNFLAAVVANHLFSREEFDSAFDVISHIPSLKDQGLVLLSLVGSSTRHQPWLNMSAYEIMILHRKLQEFPDPAVSKKLASGLWTNLGENRSDMIQELETGLNDQDRFEMALGLLAVKVRPIGSTPGFNGGSTTHFEPVDDRPEREQAAMDAGVAAGLAKAEILSSMGRVLCESIRSQEFFGWFDKHGGELQMNGSLATKDAQNNKLPN